MQFFFSLSLSIPLSSYLLLNIFVVLILAVFVAIQLIGEMNMWPSQLNRNLSNCEVVNWCDPAEILPNCIIRIVYTVINSTHTEDNIPDFYKVFHQFI